MTNAAVTTIYIVRHAESEHNANINAGREELTRHMEFGSDLSETGIVQAKIIATTFQGIHIDHILTSDLTRAKRTAEFIANEKKLAVISNEILRERHFGQHTTKLTELKNQATSILETMSGTEKMKYKFTPDMESAEEAALRFITFLRELAMSYSGQTLLIVSHGNIMRSLLTHLGFAEYDELPGESIANTGYIKLESNGVDFFVKETQGINKQQGKIRYF